MASHDEEEVCKYHEDRPVPIRAYMVMDGKAVTPHSIDLYAKPSVGDLLYVRDTKTTYEVTRVQLNTDAPWGSVCLQVKDGATRLDPA